MSIYNLISIYFLFMIYAGVYWAVQVRSFNENRYALTIQLLSGAFFIYMMGYMLQLNSNTESQILFWNRFQYLGIPYVSALWLLSALLYTGRLEKNKVLWLWFIFLIPVLTMVFRFTNEWHYFYFAALNFIEIKDKLLLERTYGPWMYVQTVHSMLMIVITLSLYLKEFISQDFQKGKVISITIASIVGVMGLVLSALNPFEYGINYMTICLPFSCLMVIIAVWKYDFMETKAIARSEAFESSRDALILLSAQNKIIDYNRQAKILFEKKKVLLTPGQMEAVFKEEPGFMKSLLSDYDSTIIVDIEKEKRVFEISTQIVESRYTLQGRIKMISDVTEAYELNKSLQYQAMMDVLSGLHNRRAFMQKSEEIHLKALENKEALYLLMMDLDHFKKVNDYHGHQTGDQVIKYIGAALKETFISDALIARLGGEEFAVQLTGLSDDEVKEKAGGFLKAFASHPFRAQSGFFHVTLSIGIAKKNHPDQSIEKLIHVADKALYKAKEMGRNRVVGYLEESEFMLD